MTDQEFDKWWAAQNIIWERHYALMKISNSAGKQGGQPWYHHALKDGRHVFLNMDSGEERELSMSREEASEMAFGSRLWQDLPFLASLYA